MAVVIAVAIVVAITGIIWYIWYRSINWRKRLRRETEEVDSSIHTVFDLLRQDIKEQLDVLKIIRGERQREQMDENVRRHLDDSFDVAEKYVKKETEDVEKELD